MREKIVTWLESLKETEIHSLMRDLLVAMGYKKISITHGPDEHGRDLVFLETDRLNRQIWRAAQVKAKAPSGSLSSNTGLRSVLNQCQAALEAPFRTQEGEEVTIREVWLVLSKQLSETAKKSAASKFGQISNVFILDAPHLADLLDENLPDALEQGPHPLQAYASKLIDACDSVEEYVQQRLTRRFSLRSVFVTPTVEFRLVNRAATQSLPPVTGSLGLSALSNDLTKLGSLAIAHMLSGADAGRITSCLSSCFRFARSCEALGIPENMDYRELTASLSYLASELGFGLAGDSWGVIEPKEDLASNVNSETIKRLEAKLLAAGWPVSDPRARAIEPLRRWRRFQKESVGRNVAQQVHGLKENRLKQEREACIRRLVRTYKFPQPEGQPLAEVTRMLRDHLYRRARGAARERVNKLASVLLGVKDKFSEIDVRLRTLHERAAVWTSLEQNNFNLSALTDVDFDSFAVVLGTSALFEQYYNSEFSVSEGKVDVATLKLPAGVALRRFRRLVLRGELGVGKTTILKHRAIDIAERYKQDESCRLPVFCSLAAISHSKGSDLSADLAHQAKGQVQGLENIGDQELTWLVDGYDEIEDSATRAHVVSWCARSREFSREITLTSRPHALPTVFPGMVQCNLLPFSQKEVKGLVMKYFADAPSDGERLLSVFESSPELNSLARIPLMATLMVIVAGEIGPEQLPRRRVQVYEVIVRLLLGEWDAMKRVRRTHVVEEVDRRMGILKKLAFIMYSRHKRAFTREDFISAACAISVGEPIDASLASALFDEFLRDCILARMAKNSAGFFHFSIQEFLAGVVMAEEIYPESLQSAVQEFFLTKGEWWEEPLVFYAGIQRDVAPLVNEMNKWVSGRGPEQGELVSRLLARWFEVADWTRRQDLQPRGLIATTLAKLNILDARAKWERLARLPA